jgi:DNA-binding GntR family transcriptional regulator
MPSATVIAEEFGIDRGTAARVPAELRNAGFIITKPGSGSLVRTAFDAEDRSVEVTEMILHSSACELEYRIEP